jgi:hypothetical protein
MNPILAHRRRLERDAQRLQAIYLAWMIAVVGLIVGTLA